MQRPALIAALTLLSLISVTLPALAARDEATIQASYDEAIGRRAKPDEVKYWMGRQDWKTEQDLVNLHRIGIKSNQALADEVIVNSYRRVFNYTPLPGGGEITHWRQHAKLGWTCKEMMVEHEKWKKANPEQAKANAAMVNALRAKNMVIDQVGNIVHSALPGQMGQILFAAGTWLYQHQGDVQKIVAGAQEVANTAAEQKKKK